MNRRKQNRVRGINDPNFLFSLPPFVEPGRILYIVLKPTGGNATPHMQAAADRLVAVGGGVMRLSAGNYAAEPFVVDRSIIVSS